MLSNSVSNEIKILPLWISYVENFTIDVKVQNANFHTIHCMLSRTKLFCTYERYILHDMIGCHIPKCDHCDLDL